ncbi:MAG: hypothetical protein QUV06_10750 [Cyanobium sp. CZS 48M]|nr:hypothetical protein [Cyanobium sp. CZS48M]
MPATYKVFLRIVRESDGKEASLEFDENGVAEIISESGTPYGHFKLLEENFPDADSVAPKGTFDQCLKYCTIDEGNSLAYCLAICAAAAP